MVVQTFLKGEALHNSLGLVNPLFPRAKGRISPFGRNDRTGFKLSPLAQG